MSNGKSDIETILKWVVVVILGFAALKILLAVLGIAWVFGAFLLFRVLPLVLVVWLVIKAVQWLTGKNGSSSTSSHSTLDV